MPISILRKVHPRLYRLPDRPDFGFGAPEDSVRRRILRNILRDCEAFARQKPWDRIPVRSESPHPFHQLYITFYSGMHATALIEHFTFAWRLTGDERWLRRARGWLLAAARWRHDDGVEEHFYTANRYMQAFAFALDLLHGRLPAREEKRVQDCLVRLLERWWPEVDKNRTSVEGGHHAVVDNGHFGVAALHLLGKHPAAESWVEAVIERFRSAIMPHGCGRNGEPRDGASFWPWENLWMLHFADALRNVTGIDLYREFPDRLKRPLRWFRHHLISPRECAGAGKRDAWSCTLLRLAQEAHDGEMREVALGDRSLGRLHRFGVGVKGSPSECMIAYGPYVYLAYEPRFRPRPTRIHTGSRLFTDASYGHSAVLRGDSSSGPLAAVVTGYGGGISLGYSDLALYWRGQPFLRAISCEEAQPVACGNLACVGGQNEFLGVLQRLETRADHDRLTVLSPRLFQEFWLLRCDPPLLLAAACLRPRSLKVRHEQGRSFVRLRRGDYLQYPREPFFNPDQGEVNIRVRLHGDRDAKRPQVLFSTGLGIGGQTGPQVNNFNLGLLDGQGLSFAVQSQRFKNVVVSAPSGHVLKPEEWHEVAARWGGFNRVRGRPFLELELDGVRQRCDDPALFGEMGKDTQNLQSRSTPRDFYVYPNTVLAFGAANQRPETAIECDLESIHLRCHGREPLSLAFPAGLAAETGGGPLLWKLNPARALKAQGQRMSLSSGPECLEVIPIVPPQASLLRQTVAYAPSGFAGSSLRWLKRQVQAASRRVLFSAEDERILVLLFKPKGRRVKVLRTPDGFWVQTPSSSFTFERREGPAEIFKMTKG
ncbi:MAG: hypothetical protein HYU36_19740 [Planctomycetes bacterium]|nr:hypothetical protein [Planctomycetota bacterium]